MEKRNFANTKTIKERLESVKFKPTNVLNIQNIEGKIENNFSFGKCNDQIHTNELKSSQEFVNNTSIIKELQNKLQLIDRKINYLIDQNSKSHCNLGKFSSRGSKDEHIRPFIKKVTIVNSAKEVKKSRTSLKSRQIPLNQINTEKYGSNKNVFKKIEDIITELKVRIEVKKIRSRSAENSMIKLSENGGIRFNLKEENKRSHSNEKQLPNIKEISKRKNINAASSSIKELKNKLSKLESFAKPTSSPLKDKNSLSGERSKKKLLKIKRKYGGNYANLPIININIMADKADPIFKLQYRKNSGCKRLKKTKSLSQCLIKHNNATLDQLLEFNKKDK